MPLGMTHILSLKVKRINRILMPPNGRNSPSHKKHKNNKFECKSEHKVKTS
jgi:hypothetical protein